MFSRVARTMMLRLLFLLRPTGQPYRPVCGSAHAGRAKPYSLARRIELYRHVSPN